MIQKVKLEQPEVDVILVTGDIVGHQLSQEITSPFDHYKYETLLQVHRNFSKIMIEQLPKTMVLPTLGNNDGKYHYQPPTDKDAPSFYGELFKLWFLNHPFNSKNLDLELIKTTFLIGGYYRVNMPGGNLTLLTMNSISFSIRSVVLNPSGEQDMQLQWLEEQLSTAEKWRKFIITNHIYYGS